MATTKDVYEQEFRATDAGMGGVMDSLTRKMGQFAESENKMKRHLTGFAQDLTNARSGADVLNAGLMRLSESFKVGLAGGVLVGLGAQMKAQTDEITERFNKIGEAQQEVMNQASQSDAAKPLEKLKTEAKAAAEQTANLQKQLNQLSGRDDYGLNALNLRETFGAFIEDMTGGRRKNPFTGVRDVLKSNLAQTGNRENDIAAEISQREAMDERRKELALTEATGPASLYKQVTIKNELLRLAKEELSLAQKSAVRDDDDIAKKRIALAIATQKSDEANAEAKFADHRIKIEEQMSSVRMSSESSLEKQYRLAKLTAEAAQAEADAMKTKNSEQATFLQLKANELKNAPKNIDESVNKGKSMKETRARFREQEREQRESEAFRKRREEAGGLLPTKRNLEGEVIEGFDPVTGEKVERKIDRFGEALEARKARAKRDGDSVDDFIGPKKPEGADAEAKGKEEAKGNKEVVTKLDEIKKELQNMVNTR